MADRCPACDERMGWKDVLRSPAWPFYAKCRACQTRLRMADPWQFVEAVLAALVPAVAVVIASRALGGLQSLPLVLLTGLASGSAAVVTMVWWSIRRAEWRIREQSVWSDPAGRRFLMSAIASGLIGLVLVIGVTAFSVAALKNYGRSGLSFPASADIVPLGTVDAEWTVQSVDGRRRSLGDLRGRPVFVNFWATWCPPCIAEMPSIQALYESLQSDDIEFLVVSHEPPSIVEGFLAENGYTFPVYVTDEAPPSVLASDGIPATFILNPQGEVVFRHVGMADWDTDDCRQFLRDLR